eukprot:1653374-Rhodomonas_salina.3
MPSSFKIFCRHSPTPIPRPPLAPVDSRVSTTSKGVVTVAAIPPAAAPSRPSTRKASSIGRVAWMTGRALSFHSSYSAICSAPSGMSRTKTALADASVIARAESVRTESTIASRYPRETPLCTLRFTISAGRETRHPAASPIAPAARKVIIGQCWAMPVVAGLMNRPFFTASYTPRYIALHGPSRATLAKSPLYKPPSSVCLCPEPRAFEPFFLWIRVLSVSTGCIVMVLKAEATNARPMFSNVPRSSIDFGINRGRWSSSNTLGLSTSSNDDATETTSVSSQGNAGQRSPRRGLFA